MEWAAELHKLALPILLPGITISKKPGRRLSFLL
jgi:hypothetical protein